MLNVSDVTLQLKDIIKDVSDLQDVWTRGRIISKVALTRSGTLNFTITDNGEEIECVIFKDGVPLQKKMPAVGNNVSVRGRIYVYDAKSEYRFVVTDISLPGDAFLPQFLSINDLMKTLSTTLKNQPAVEVQGEIDKVFKTPAGSTILKLKDIARDGSVIECMIPPEINPLFPLRQGEAITVKGKFEIFTVVSTYSIVIEDPKGLKKLLAPEKGGKCKGCGQPCKPPNLLCTICHYAQVHHEGIVVGAVLRYFKAPKFVNFSTKREYRVKFGTNVGRADVVLLNSEGSPAAIAECKRIGDGGLGGIEQLESYLNATRTDLGLFADDTDPCEWSFFKRNDADNTYDKITRFQFERELGVEPPTETDQSTVENGIRNGKSPSDPVLTPPDEQKASRSWKTIAFAFAVAFVISLTSTFLLWKKPPPEPVVYITRTGVKYHTYSCDFLKRHAQEKFAILLDTAKKDYDPCGICKPEVP